MSAYQLTKRSSSSRVMTKVSELWAKLLAEEEKSSRLRSQVRKQKVELKAGEKERQQLMDTCDQLIYTNRRLQSDEKYATKAMTQTLQDYREVQNRRLRKRSLAATRVAAFQELIATLRQKFERQSSRPRLLPVGTSAMEYEREIALIKDGYTTTLSLIHSLQQSADELMDVFGPVDDDTAGLEEISPYFSSPSVAHRTTALGELTRRLEEENETLRRNLSEERERLARYQQRSAEKVQKLRDDLSLEKASGKRLANRLAEAHRLKSFYQEQLILDTTKKSTTLALPPTTPIRTSRSRSPYRRDNLSTDLRRLDTEIHSLEDSIMSMTRSMGSQI